MASSVLLRPYGLSPTARLSTMSTATRSVLVERGPVNLGCGTLILIALIVLFFSNRPDNNGPQLRQEIQRLQSQVGNLQRSIDDQTTKLSRLEEQIRRQGSKEKGQIQPEAPAKE